MALLKHELGKYEESLSISQEARDLSLLLYSQSHRQVGRARYVLATALKKMNQLDEAQGECQLAMEIFERSLGSRHPSTITVYDLMGSILDAAGKPQDAVTYFETALAALRDTRREMSEDYANCQLDLGGALFHLGELQRAKNLAYDSIQRLQTIHGPNSLPVARALAKLSLALSKGREYDEAASCLCEAIEMMRARLPAKHPTLIDAEVRLAQNLKLANRSEEAEPVWRDLAGLLCPPQSSKEVLTNVLQDLIEFHDARGHHVEAGEWRTKLAKLNPTHTAHGCRESLNAGSDFGACCHVRRMNFHFVRSSRNWLAPSFTVDVS